MPALFQTAVLALLSAAVPMRATATASCVAIVLQDKTKKMITDPSPREVEIAKSVHVLAFTSQDELLLAESEGDFTVKDWDDVYEVAKTGCSGLESQAERVEMVLDDVDAGKPGMRHFIRAAMEHKVAADLHWK